MARSAYYPPLFLTQSEDKSMKNKIIIIILCMLIVGCANKNWQYVRIEGEVPAANCIYKMQESCSQKTNACLNWHKKRAVSFGADTVVITHSEKLQNYATQHGQVVLTVARMQVPSLNTTIATDLKTSSRHNNPDLTKTISRATKRLYHIVSSPSVGNTANINHK